MLCVYCNGATCFDSYRIIFRPFCDTEPHLAMFKTRCGIPKAYILDITVYKMHVSLCSYCTVGTLVSETLTGTYGGGYTYVLEMSFYRTLDIVIYTVANYKICVQDHTVRHPRCVSINYNWINQLSNTTIWWLDICCLLHRYQLHVSAVMAIFRLID